MRHLGIVAAAIGLLFGGQSPSYGLNGYGDIPLIEYEQLGAQDIFDSVGYILGDDGTFGSGVLLRDSLGRATRVATAAHTMFDDDGNLRENLTFGVGTSIATSLEVVSVSNITVHPDFTSLAVSPDIAILELADEITTVAPATLFEGMLQEGEMIYSGDFGFLATPESGFIINDGIRRGMMNLVDGYGGGIGASDDYALLSFFTPNALDRIRLGGAYTRGGSGGFNGPIVDGELQYAGPSGFVAGGDGYLSLSGFYQVSADMDFLQEALMVPEPSSLVLLALGSMGILLRRRAA